MDWPGATAWLGLLAEYQIKTTLVLFLCLLAVSAARRQAAAVRHFLLSFFLIGLLLLPVLSISRFGWKTNLLPARATGMEPHGAAAHRLPSEADLLRARPPAAAPEAASLKASEAGGIVVVAAISQPSGSGGFLSASIPFLWSAGLALLLLKIGLGILGAYRLTLQGIDVSDPNWRILLARFLAVIRIRKTVRLKSHAGIRVPITWGLLRPVILLPLRHENWTEDQRSTALLHELGHIKRADFLVLSLVRLSLAVFWFNPLCWVVYRRIKQEQERACDDLVLTAGIKPSTYAATLLFFKRTAGCRNHVSAAFLGLFGSASFHERLAAILRQKLTLKEVTMKTKLTLASAVILAVSLIGLARPSAAVPETRLSSILRVSAAPQTAVPPASVPPLAAGNNDQDKKVEAGKGQAKKAAQQKRTIVITNKQGEKVPIEIVTTPGDAKATVKVEKALILKRGADGDLILADAGGKELEILNTEPVRVTVAGKDLVILHEGGVFKIERRDLAQVAANKDKAGAPIRFVVTRPFRIADKNGAERLILSAQNKTGEQQLVYLLAQEKLSEMKAKVGELSNKLLQDRGHQTEKAQLERQKLEKAQVEKGKVEKEPLDKRKSEMVQLERQKVAKALEKLKPRLELLAESQPLKVLTPEKRLTLGVVRPKVAAASGRGIYVMRDAGKGVMAVWMSDSAGFSVLFGVGSGEGNRQIYDRVLARIKQELPAGYAVDPEFNEKSGDVTLTISGPDKQEVPIELIKKVTEAIRSEIKSQE